MSVTFEHRKAFWNGIGSSKISVKCTEIGDNNIEPLKYSHHRDKFETDGERMDMLKERSRRHAHQQMERLFAVLVSFRWSPKTSTTQA
ncbi:hypothetical protein TNCV_3529841 [Trichonephila clavipes]|uniref:Uncharacterized protein n=1 Tax=Trichonephila clavipes TaxID=2585209 RepID=A0A8X6RJT8_TRICX|nr:hypothetical protein TNCV_3529841 [Trichonephila clavipes]